LATAAAGLFALTVGCESTGERAGLIVCEGGNACHGQSECSTGVSACRGKNSCKGRGWVTLSPEQCQKARTAPKM